jgi:hypothetical protein
MVALELKGNMTTVPPQRHIETALSAVICALLLIWLSSCAVARSQILDEEMGWMLDAVTRPVASGAAPVPDVGTPYAWWKMTGTDTNANGDLLDSASSGYSFTNKGAVLVSTNGSYYQFTNGASFVNMRGTNIPSSMAHTSFTVTAWVYLLGASSGGSGVLFNELSSPAKYAWECIALVGSGMDFYVLSDDAGNNYIQQKSAAGSVSVNNWYHMAWVYDGGTTTNALKLYINGTRSQGASSQGGSFTGKNQTALPLLLGGGSAAWSLNGYVDDVRFFKNEALTQTQITNQYDAGRQ